MKTDNLIDLLSQDTPVRFRLGRLMFSALVIGAILSAIMLVVTIGVRPHISDALQNGRVIFKLVVTMALAVTAFNLALNVGKPGIALGRHVLALGVPLAILILGVTFELLAVPAGQWEANLVGRYSSYCLIYIPLLSFAPFAAFFWALKHAAPEDSGFAGAAMGLASAGIGAAIYAWHCPDDSPLFVATWYVIAIVVVTLLGYFVGRRWLVW